MIEPQRLQAAYEIARADLLAQRNEDGYWVGELAASALSTATAVSALSIVVRERTSDGDREGLDSVQEMIRRGIDWLTQHQNADGGFGDTDKSYSNIATSMLVVAAMRLTGLSDEHSDLVNRAEKYFELKGGIEGLRKRYGKDKTFAVPILTNCALAGMVSWNDVSPLPFEAACVPQSWYRFMQMPVVSYAIPALVAIGQARYFHRKPFNPITRLIRAASVSPSLKVLERMQPASGGYLEAIPLTSFVVMAIAGTGRADHTVVRNGVKFIRSSVRADGSWPIDTNLATWNTTLSLNALAGAGEDVSQFDCLSWLLSCQHTEVHPFTGAEPGGWGWTDLSGAVPDADDTPGALLALRHLTHDSIKPDLGTFTSGLNGISWLCNLQNRDGGWPTFCRGWGKLPFDRSGADLTAHTIRALSKWQTSFSGLTIQDRIKKAIHHGFEYLDRQQRSNGSWVPLWFGNQDDANEENPVYGTAKVLLAYRDCGRSETDVMRRGLNWLRDAQNEDGGWGGGPALADFGHDPNLNNAQETTTAHRSSVEETALAVEALLAAEDDPSLQGTIDKGLEWLCSKVEKKQHRENSPIGFYFAKLWYHETLYPLIFTVSALGQALQKSHPRPESQPNTARLTNA